MESQVTESTKEEMEKFSGMSGAYILQLMALAQHSGVTLEADISVIEDTNRIQVVQNIGGGMYKGTAGARLPSMSGFNNDPQMLQKMNDLETEVSLI